jgi:uncharacterized protein YbbK (DUF523 family)
MTVTHPLQSILISSCLLGESVRHNGAHKRADSEILQRWLTEGRVVAVCPEVAGGMPIPRPAAEIERGAGGAKVLIGIAKVIDNTGRDVSSQFVAGAEHALAKARERGIRIAVLKEGSPSCGSGYTYDGTFTSTRTTHQGVTATLLSQDGVRVFSETQFAEADALLTAFEMCAE